VFSFYIPAFIAVVSTFLVITNKNAIHALIYMIISLLSAAVIFYTLGAPFAAALEVIVYAGAIVVLFVFVVMMLNLGERSIDQEREWLRPSVWIGPSILAAILGLVLAFDLARGGGYSAGGVEVGPKEVSQALFGPYLLGVELASFLLLSGLVGAYHLGRRIRSGGGEE
jgi:NADH-quinone oxidoreductase subunit J